MSVPVPLAELASAVARYGRGAYLLTVSGEGRPHAVLTELAWDDGSFVADVGNRTAANVAARPLVSALWAPAGAGGFTLIVDADAEVTGEGEARRVRLRPTHAVLHRPLGT